MTRTTTALTLMLLLTAALAAQQAVRSAEYQSAEAKFHQMHENSAAAPVKAETTVLKEAEWNAYLAEGGVKLPPGVHKPHCTSEPGEVTCTATVDFDELTSSQPGRAPRFPLFIGTHDVKGAARVWGVHGDGFVQVTLVEIDGVAVPHRLLEYFASTFLRPRNGQHIGLYTKFTLPTHIDSAGVGAHDVTLQQK